MKTKRTIGDISLDTIIYLTMIVIIVATMYPFLNSLAISFNHADDTTRGGVTLWPRVFTTRNYELIFTNSKVYMAYIITILRTVIGTLTGLFFTSILAFGLAHKMLVGRRFYTMICLIPMFFGGGLIPTYFLIRFLGLTNNFWVYIIPNLVNLWNMILMRTYFAGIPEALEESARIDGASYIRVFFRIVFPISTPIVATICLYIGVFHWNSWFDAAMYINDQNLKPMQSVLISIINEAKFAEQIAAQAGGAVTDMGNIGRGKPDADAAAKLNLMISSGDLPDVIQMDRGADHKRMAEMGLLVDLAPLQAVNPSFDEDIAQSTQDLLKINDVLYSVPHWARKGPTGGNDMWLYDKRLYEEAGSSDLSTFEGLYAYAKHVKDNIPETKEGLPVIPFATENNANAHEKITLAFYRSMGGPNWGNDHTARIDGKMQSIFRDPVFRQAVMEANKWYREGLISETQFSDTNDQMVEKFTSGRTALLNYDHSQDSINRFRHILMETYPDDSYEMVLDPVYPPAEGVDKIYADAKETIGWNVLSITTKAEQPQRIFDLFSYMLTKQGSIEMMYGPQGDWWEELDENGNPILHTPEAELVVEEKDRIGAWFWSFCSHSDNVDLTKFAVNEMQPPEKRDWVISTQADVLTPIMFVTDEYVGLNTTIDQLSDLGIQRTLCDEEYRAQLPKMIMAGTAEEAEALYDDFVAFLDANNFAEIERIYDEHHQSIVEIQGGSAYD